MKKLIKIFTNILCALQGHKIINSNKCMCGKHYVNKHHILITPDNYDERVENAIDEISCLDDCCSCHINPPCSYCLAVSEICKQYEVPVDIIY